MCNGLAILVNGNKEVVCKGLRSHDETKKGLNDDDFLDFEVYLPKVFEPVWDSGDSTCLKVYKEKGLLDFKDKPKRELVSVVVEWLKINELQVRKWFNENQELLGNQSVKGKMFIHGMVVGNPESRLNKEIERLSKEFSKEGKTLDLESFYNEITKQKKEKVK